MCAVGNCRVGLGDSKSWVMAGARAGVGLWVSVTAFGVAGH